MLQIKDNQLIVQESAIKELINLEKQSEEIEKKKKEIHRMLLEEMENKGIKKYEDDNIIITYIDPTTRETFDSKALKEEDIDTYDKYIKIVNVKSSVRVKIKEQDEKLEKIKEIING